MNPELFLRDLDRGPETLATLAAGQCAGATWEGIPWGPGTPVVLLGMGSSHYANAVAAARLRARGVPAVAELASSDLLPSVTQAGTVVVAVSASGGSTETLAAVEQYRDRATVVALTNTPDSALAAVADAVVLMGAEVEEGGVACRSFQHTLGLLLMMEDALLGTDTAGRVLPRAAEASAHVLGERSRWLPGFADLALGPQGTHLVAPARRLSSAQQGALMLREGPRLPATACETGDWSHVDVYLTKTTDYRMVLFTGSRWEPELLRWVEERGSRVACVGTGLPQAEVVVDYPHSGDDDVRLLTEFLVPTVLAADTWLSTS